MAGLTQNGLEIRTQPEIQALLEEALELAFPGANVRAGPLHQLVGILSEELALAWETLQAVYSAAYPEGASGSLLDQVAALTGTRRRAATRSRVLASVNLNAGTTLPAGSIAAVEGNPDAQFRTVEAVTNTDPSAANVDVVLEALRTGRVAAPALSLTVIVTPVSGWNSITNAVSAELGLEKAEDDELRMQRVIELAGAGRRTLPSIRAAVARVEGVRSVQVIENVTSVPDSGRPPKSFEVVVWDGSPGAADDDAVAQAIWDRKPEGIEVADMGGVTGYAETETGATVAVPFTRAAELTVYVAATVVLAPGTGAAWVTQAQDVIAARSEEYSVGETAYASQLMCALLDEVPGIVAVTALTLGTAPAPVGALVAADYDQVIRIAAADVAVST